MASRVNRVAGSVAVRANRRHSDAISLSLSARSITLRPLPGQFVETRTSLKIVPAPQPGRATRLRRHLERRLNCMSRPPVAALVDAPGARDCGALGKPTTYC